MTQITFVATTATTCATGGVATTGNMHTLPAWAPEIAYIDTTAPWLAVLQAATTCANPASSHGAIIRCKVRAYKTKGGAQVVALSSEASGAKAMLLTLSYRAVGELIRT